MLLTLTEHAKVSNRSLPQGPESPFPISPTFEIKSYCMAQIALNPFRSSDWPQTQDPPASAHIAWHSFNLLLTQMLSIACNKNQREGD